MVESSITQASPISGQPTPREVVETFLRLTVDTADLKRARLHLTKRSVASGRFEAAPVPAGSTYTLGAEEADGLGRRIAVNLKRPAADGGPEEVMTVPMIVVEEEGQWKIDLPATMERLMGGMGEAMDKVVEKAGEALAGALGDTGKALAEGLGGMMVPEVKGGAEKRPKVAAAKKKAVKKVVRKIVKKRVKSASRKARKAAVKKASKPAKRPVKKAARKPARRPSKTPVKKRKR